MDIKAQTGCSGCTCVGGGFQNTQKRLQDTIDDIQYVETVTQMKKAYTEVVVDDSDVSFDMQDLDDDHKTETILCSRASFFNSKNELSAVSESVPRTTIHGLNISPLVTARNKQSFANPPIVVRDIDIAAEVGRISSLSSFTKNNFGGPPIHTFHSLQENSKKNGENFVLLQKNKVLRNTDENSNHGANTISVDEHSSQGFHIRDGIPMFQATTLLAPGH